LTKRVRSVWGRMSWPGVQAELQEYQETTMTQQRTLALALNKRFFFALMVLLAPKWAAAGFLDLALGWSLRRSERCLSFFFQRKGEDDRASEL